MCHNHSHLRVEEVRLLLAEGQWFLVVDPAQDIRLELLTGGPAIRISCRPLYVPLSEREALQVSESLQTVELTEPQPVPEDGPDPYMTTVLNALKIEFAS